MYMFSHLTMQEYSRIFQQRVKITKKDERSIKKANIKKELDKIKNK